MVEMLPAFSKGVGPDVTLFQVDNEVKFAVEGAFAEHVAVDSRIDGKRSVQSQLERGSRPRPSDLFSLPGSRSSMSSRSSPTDQTMLARLPGWLVAQPVHG